MEKVTRSSSISGFSTPFLAVKLRDVGRCLSLSSLHLSVSLTSRRGSARTARLEITWGRGKADFEIRCRETPSVSSSFPTLGIGLGG